MLFGGTVTVALLTETDRLIGGGEKLVFPPPQPVTVRSTTARRRLLHLTILQHLLRHFSRRSRPLLLRLLAPHPLELDQSFLLFVLIAKSSIYLGQAIPSDLVPSIQRDRLLQMRQCQVWFLLRHQRCCQTHLRFLKIRVVFQRGRKKLLRLVKLVLLAMDLSQLIQGVGIARIDL